jgi:hypothetical protein
MSKNKYYLKKKNYSTYCLIPNVMKSFTFSLLLIFKNYLFYLLPWFKYNMDYTIYFLLDLNCNQI